MSGGVAVLVKEKFVQYIEEMNIEIDNCVALKIRKSVFNTMKDILLVGIYIPPYNSNYWKHAMDGYGLELLDKCVIEAHKFCSELSLICFGDINARTSNLNAEFDYNDDSYFQQKHCMMNIVERSSQDKEVNQFGDQLLEFCNIHDCFILNGLKKMQFDDSFTYICNRGSSVLDYYIMSYDICNILEYATMSVKDIVESDHVPIELILNIESNVAQASHSIIQQKDSYVYKLIWQEHKEGEYKENLSNECHVKKIKEATAIIEEDINEAIQVFNDSLKSAAQCMSKMCGTCNTKKGRKWYDQDCRLKKRECRRRLRYFRQERNEQTRKCYVDSRKCYKQLVKLKKENYQKSKIESLENNLNKPQFWKELNELGGACKGNICEEITIDEWYDHFSNVFKQDTAATRTNTHINHDELSQNEEHVLNAPITKEEVSAAIKNLHSHKAGGLDGVVPEMLKRGGDEVICFLTKLFNKVFDSGIYPSDWAKAIVVPIFKKGDAHQPDNYRGISLINTACKCFTSILNKRLYSWLEENKMIVENQAGFRKKYSTTDHIFTLYSAIQKCLNKKGQKVYVAFVDFRKAFDSVSHEMLFKTIEDRGIKGKFYVTVRSMYESLMACIRIKNDLSEFFDCPVGVRQGCVLSPTLFSLFINQLATHINVSGVHGIQLLPNLLDLFILLFADDIALISLTPGGLQIQLDILKQCCDRLKLMVNKEKTKIMVFRKGGFLGQNEQWNYDSERLEVVNKYLYLGFTFTTMLSFNIGTSHLLIKAKRALVGLSKAFQTCKGMSQSTYFRIFDAKIQSILLYSSEIWGYQRLENIEKVHLLACKRFLGVPLKTPNKMVYGELGRYPLYVMSTIRCITYWFKILQMSDNRMPKQAYNMMLLQDNKGKICWATQIKEILSKTGFYYVWVRQGTDNLGVFLKIFKQRLIDQFRQEWEAVLRDKERYVLYASVKDNLSTAKYLDNIDVYCFRVAIAQIRCGVLPINNNLNRYGHDINKSLCPFCETIEDEKHFLFACFMYDELRSRFLPDAKEYYMRELLSCQSNKTSLNLAKFVFHAIKLRHKILDDAF
jgi:hypothetical protein